MEDPKIEVSVLLHENNMYMGISEREPLAEYDAAPLASFSDFFIVFHSNYEILTTAGTIEPFKKLSNKSGFVLKPLYIDPHDTSAYYLATEMHIAVPSLRRSFKYTGIKFVRISDWESYCTSYFLSLKANNRGVLSLFKKSIRAYMYKNRLSSRDNK